MKISKFFDFLEFHEVKKVKVIPVSLKIVFVLSVFLILSNLTTNYISLGFNQVNQTHSSKELLVKDLKGLLNFINIQWQINKINENRELALLNIEKKSRFELEAPSSVFIGVDPDAKVIFSTLSQPKEQTRFDLTPIKANEALNENFVVTRIDDVEYFGVYKFNSSWDMYVFRGEQIDAFYAKTWENFVWIVAIIVLVTIILAVCGTYAVKHILRFIGLMTADIIDMSKNQHLKPIDMKNAANDDVTYLGMAFNGLSSDVDNLVKIFKKFTDRDIVQKAYQDKQISLDGEQKDLTMLFTDIKGYTTMTEVLGADVIKLLNIQYDHAISHIYSHEGIIASIIGDALLAVYGVLPSDQENKSYGALLSAYKIIDATSELKHSMQEKRALFIQEHGELPEEDERIYQAMLLDVGIGLDCGSVFYGTIGSNLRMTSTVIGDSVNSAARIEGLTRIYGVPVICSDNVRKDVLESTPEAEFSFINIDRVQVKGKTEGVKLYWPIRTRDVSTELEEQLVLFKQGLADFHTGNWPRAQQSFIASELAISEVFIERTQQSCPQDWAGIWVLNEK